MPCKKCGDSGRVHDKFNGCGIDCDCVLRKRDEKHQTPQADVTLNDLLGALEAGECSLMCAPILLGDDDYEVLWVVADQQEAHIGQGSTPTEALKDAFGT